MFELLVFFVKLVCEILVFGVLAFLAVLLIVRFFRAMLETWK